jgi:hypothetical protein
MDKIEKLFRKEQTAMVLLFEQIKTDFSKIPGLLKLKGHQGLYRVRMGNYRIIFKQAEAKRRLSNNVAAGRTTASTAVEIIRISRRNEQTYKNL